MTLLASLELAKDGLIELVQNNTDELFIKSLRVNQLSNLLINSVEALLFGSGRPIDYLKLKIS